MNNDLAAYSPADSIQYHADARDRLVEQKASRETDQNM